MQIAIIVTMLIKINNDYVNVNYNATQINSNLFCLCEYFSQMFDF